MGAKMTEQLLGEPAAGRRTKILSHLDGRTPGRSLPGALYTDPDVFTSEVELLWRRRWLFVGTVAEVPEPGDYVTFDVAGSSVLVIRDDDEQVRAFHNVCRHRGSRLVTSGNGSVGNLVCGYHSWTYATDGSLRYAPQLSPEIDTTCLGLRPVALREVGGLLFCSLAAEPTATSTWSPTRSAVISPRTGSTGPRSPRRSTWSRRPTGSW